MESRVFKSGRGRQKNQRDDSGRRSWPDASGFEDGGKGQKPENAGNL